MPTTVTTDEAVANLPSLIVQAHTTPVIIREGEMEVAMIVAPERFWEEKLARAEQFEKSRGHRWRS